MRSRVLGNRSWAAVGLLAMVLVIGAVLTAWKSATARAATAAAANQPEPVEAVTAAVAERRQYRGTTTSIGTVLALRSIALRNEVPGTVREVTLAPGRIVEAGALLVAFDVSVEEAELAAQEAQAVLTETVLGRTQRLRENRAVSEEEMERARAERDVALAQIARTKAIIARKTIRAPFRARVGIADVHAGQFLDAGTQLTTLQGVDGAVHVDFAVPQMAAEGLRPGDAVQVFTTGNAAPIAARIVAVDARIDPTTRSATVRARIGNGNAHRAPAPGGSVRVRIPVGASQATVAIPASALRKGPGGDHVFVLVSDSAGQTRAHVRLVQAGPILGDEVLILEGLAAGERVAASGSFKLRESVLVGVAEAK